MAWSVQYKGEFRDVTYLNNTEGLLWTVDIESEDPGAVKYGLLYNWYAVTDARNIAAAGWIVPYTTEYVTLRNYLVDPAGGKLKETGLVYWNTPNTNADNTSGFNGRGSGSRDSGGNYADIKVEWQCWTTRAHDANSARFVRLTYNSDAFYDATYSADNNCGLCIRLIKETTTLTDGQTGTYTGNDGKIYPTICIGTQEWVSCNLSETKFRDGSAITEISDNTQWAAATTAAMCAYDNNWTYVTEGVPPSEMLMADPSLTIEHLAAGDDLLLTPVKGSTATINVWSETNFQYTGLYSAENFKYRVSIYYGDIPVLYWRGYLTSEYTEPYDDTPYMVSIAATDGLGLLKNMPYKYTVTNKDDTYYDGRRYESQVIIDILTKIGHTGFNEHCNLYEDRMTDAVSNSPFDQILIDMDVFKDKTCYEVLEEVLKKYNAVIKQSRGVFWIGRPTELDATVNYRTFTAYATKTNSTFTPIQYIHRTEQSSAIKDFNGGVLMLQSPTKQFTAEQDYGNKESWLDNYKFEADTYDDSTYSFDNWTRVGPAGIQRPVSFVLIKKEYEGIAFLPTTNTPPDLSSFVYQTFGTYAKQTSNDIILEFEYRLVNITGAAVTNLDITFIIGDATSEWYLNELDDNYLEWVNAYRFVTITEATVPEGQGEWISYSRSIPGLPIDGPFIIELFQANQGIHLCYRNIRFSTTSDATIVRSKKVSRWKPWVLLTPLAIVRFFGGGYKKVRDTYITDNEDIVSKTYVTPDPMTIEGSLIGQSYILGDCEDTEVTNVLEQFKGSLAISITGSLTKTADDFVTDFIADYLAGGVLLSSVGDTLYFESDTAGVDFTGSTTITNASGNLTGTPSTVTANSAGGAQVATITLSGSSGLARVTISPLAFSLVTFDTDLTTTAENFVTDYATYYAGYNITLTSSNEDIIFTETVISGGFGTVAITNKSGTLTGTLPSAKQTAPGAPVARVDKIILSGTSGTANVLCDGTTKLATYFVGTTVDHTMSWHTRGNTEAKPVIELVADEIATQYARERHFIQANLRETSVTAPDVNVIYGFKDTLNTYSGSARLFACNRGTFNVKSREWSIDLHEIL